MRLFRRSPQPDLAPFITDYRENGVVRIPAVFSPSEIDAARASGYMTLTRLDDITRGGYRHTVLETVSHHDVPFPAVLFWPALADRHLDSLRTDDRLVRIVTAFLGSDVKQLNNQLYFRLPGDDDSFAWHQDIVFRTPREQYPGIVENDAYLQTAIIIDRIEESNAPIIYVMGSHKLGDLRLIGDDWKGLRGFSGGGTVGPFAHLEGAQRAVTAEPGDVLVWSALTVHASCANRSDKPRMYYMNGFARSQHCVPWPEYTRDGKLVPLEAARIP